MLCERCKIREANIQYTEVMNGVKKEHNFCAQCARELDFGPYSAIFDGEFPLGKLLSGLLGVAGENHEAEIPQVVCPTCGTSYAEFVKNSRFGCPDCYGVFDLLISDNIKQLQGSDQHKGKKPHYHEKEHSAVDFSVSADDSDGRVPDVEEQLRILDARLHEALSREEYEMAAQCRDKIRELKEGADRC